MTAIGPFCEPTELDLAKFGESGLFLIEGATGAGKSTILDAISFALYGRLARAGTSTERLTSHHAPVGTEPVVELVFETQSGRYRIRRTAPYERAKKRGEGTLPVRMTVALYRLTDPDSLDEGELISNNLGDAEDEITRAVGLTHGQFVQTVLLPQGEFANFLSAKTDVKRDLLQKLFGTEILERTQAKLIEGRQQAEKLRKGAIDAVRATVNAFAGVADLSDATVTELVSAAELGASDALTSAVATEQASLSTTVERAAATLQLAEAARIAAEARRQHEHELHGRRTLRADLRARHQHLVEQAGEQALAGAELATAERALMVSPAADAVRAARAAVAQGRTREAAARRGLPADLADADDRALRVAGSQRATMLGGLEPELARERELVDRRRRAIELDTAQAEQKDLVVQGETAMSELPERRRQLAAAITEAERAAAQQPAVVAERDRAVSRLRAAQRAEAAAIEAAQDKLVAQELFDSAEEAEQRVARLRRQWRTSIASQLGLALKEGDPCSVCGSVEHPQPARPTADSVSQEQLQEAEQDLSTLQQQVEVRRSQLADKQAELMQLQLAAEQLTPDKAQATLDKVSETLDAVAATADQLPGLTEEVRELEQNLSQLQDIVAQARLEVATRAEQLSQLADTIARDEAAVSRARDAYPSVGDRMVAIQAEIDVIDAAAGAIEQTRALLATSAAADEAFRQALDQAGFDDEPDWRLAVRTSAQLQQLRAQVREYTEQLSSIQARLVADDLTDPALDAAPADLGELNAEFEQARLTEKAAAQEHGAAADRVAAAGRLAGRVLAAVQQSESLLAETSAAIRIGNLVAGLGENQLKMELTTYVLVRRFADVLAAANNQLQRISQGRYRLEHTDARTGSAKSGLNLRVVDQHTGLPRDPATLSGGETFYVSLALALGLADVVRAESGGIELGTLFIDEGFGTLDAEVLDEVINVLDGLRHGGRAVGIVSHVSELKMRIADRIKVERSIDGTSRLLTTV